MKRIVTKSKGPLDVSFHFVDLDTSLWKKAEHELPETITIMLELALRNQHVVLVDAKLDVVILGTRPEEYHMLIDALPGDPRIPVAREQIKQASQRFSQSFERIDHGLGSMFSRMFKDIMGGSMNGFDEFPGIPRPQRKPLSFLTDQDWVRLEAMLLKNQAHQMLEIRQLKSALIEAMNDSAANRVARTIEWFPGYWLIWLVSSFTRMVVHGVVAILELLVALMSLLWWAFSYPFEFMYYTIYPDRDNGKKSCPHCTGTRFGVRIRRWLGGYKLFFYTYSDLDYKWTNPWTPERFGHLHRRWLNNLVWFVTWPYRRFCEMMQDPDNKVADLIFWVLSPLFSIKFDA